MRPFCIRRSITNGPFRGMSLSTGLLGLVEVGCSILIYTTNLYLLKRERRVMSTNVRIALNGCVGDAHETDFLRVSGMEWLWNTGRDGRQESCVLQSPATIQTITGLSPSATL